MITYADSGVDVERGDEASAILYEASKRTWSNRKGKTGEVRVGFDDFSGLRTVRLPTDPKIELCIGFDTVGTKSEIAERVGKYDTLAFDLIAMVADDAVVKGGEPAIVGSNLEINSLGKNGDQIPLIRELANGYEKAAAQAGVAVLNGELAEIGDRVQGFGTFNLNWGAACIWFARSDRMLNGKEIRPGDSIIGLREKGFRCNGISLVRKVFLQRFGENWHLEEYEGRSLGGWVLTPSLIYSKLIVEMAGGVDAEGKIDVHGVAHITGGGLPGKVGRMLKPTSLGATIHSPFEPGPALQYCQEIGKIEDEEAYRTWNMGQGMVIVVPHPQAALDVAKEFGMEAKVIGEITKEPGVRICSRGKSNKGKTFSF